MQLVIEISDGLYNNLGTIKNGSIASKIILDCVRKGQVLPKGHGRLIDADKLKDQIIEVKLENVARDIRVITGCQLEDSSTIIEADKEEV